MATAKPARVKVERRSNRTGLTADETKLAIIHLWCAKDAILSGEPYSFTLAGTTYTLFAGVWNNEAYARMRTQDALDAVHLMYKRITRRDMREFYETPQGKRRCGVNHGRMKRTKG